MPYLKHLSQAILEEKIFKYISFLKPKNPATGPFSTPGPPFEQTWQRSTRQCYILNFKHLSQVVLEKKIFEYFSMYFYGSNLGPPA